MSLFSCNRQAISRFLVASACATLTPSLFAGVEYEVRALTGDNIWVGAYAPKQEKFVKAKRRQGSFGGPAINDNGIVAYPCIMAGAGLDTFHNVGLILKDATRAPRLAIQSGFRLNNNFMPDRPTNVANSARVWQMGQNVGINKQGRLAFSARILNVYKDKDGNDVSSENGAYGTAVPSGNTFKNSSIATFEDYNEDVLTVPLSFNAQGAVAYNATFLVTDDKGVEGFGYGNIKTENDNEPGRIATVESTVIGLPYNTTFKSFSQAVIADKNVGFVVAALSDGGTDFDGIWQGNNPNLQPVVVKTSQAPGGGQFTSFGEIPGPSRNGAYCAFLGTVTGNAVTNGVYRSDKKGSDVQLITKIGAAVPGLNGGKSPGTFSAFDFAVSSNLGQVVVTGSITPTNGGNARKGIWLTNREGKNLTQLVTVGQTLTIRKKQKVITQLTVNPIGCVNRNGDVVFTASFNDRTSAVIIAKAGLK